MLRRRGWRVHRPSARLGHHGLLRSLPSRCGQTGYVGSWNTDLTHSHLNRYN